jgi:hypothetical protein
MPFPQLHSHSCGGKILVHQIHPAQIFLPQLLAPLAVVDLGLNQMALGADFVIELRRGAFESSLAQEAEVRQYLIVTSRRKLAAAYVRGLQDDRN